MSNLSPAQHIAKYGLANLDACTLSILQQHALELRPLLTLQQSAAQSTGDKSWLTELKQEIADNEQALVAIAGIIGQPSAQILRAVQSTIQYRAEAYRPRRIRR